MAFHNRSGYGQSQPEPFWLRARSVHPVEASEDFILFFPAYSYPVVFDGDNCLVFGVFEFDPDIAFPPRIFYGIVQKIGKQSSEHGFMSPDDEIFFGRKEVDIELFLQDFIPEFMDDRVYNIRDICLQENNLFAVIIVFSQE